jgi:hypothetical protein
MRVHRRGHSDAGAVAEDLAVGKIMLGIDAPFDRRDDDAGSTHTAHRGATGLRQMGSVKSWRRAVNDAGPALRDEGVLIERSVERMRHG